MFILAQLKPSRSVRRCKPSRSIARVEPSRYIPPSRSVVLILITMAVAGVALSAQNPIQPPTDTPLARDPLTPAPNRAPGEGFGPYQTMVVRGAMLIDGTGGPPRGPVDIVVNGNRIAAIRN